jgi:radical SAM protein with 4Fe4S-binding SPASM domain
VEQPRYVEVETSRYCNRQCGWCPNHLSLERRSQELMDWSIFQAVIESLSRHCYDGWLAFHNYNEPLANPRIFREIAFAREQLPQAKTTIFTNGDYLTADLFDELVEAGLAQMRITVYPQTPSAEAPSHASLWRWLKRRPFLHEADWKEVSARQGPGLVLEQPVAIEIISPDISRYYDRGGMLPALSIAGRSTPCFLTSNSLSIDYRGDIKMCCNIVTGQASHEQYLFGNVRDRDPIDTWNSPRFAEVRREHRRADWSDTPICRTCRQELPKP